MNIENPELQLAGEFVQHTGCNIFLTGKAGTGKTTFLLNLKKHSAKRMIVTAPTGVAAINAGGSPSTHFFSYRSARIFRAARHMRKAGSAGSDSARKKSG